MIPRLSTAIGIPTVKGTISITVFAASLAGLALLYGTMACSKYVAGKVIKIDVVQGNIEQSIKWNRKYAGFIMKTYTDLTREVMTENPHLIVWPETATPRSIFENQQVLSAVSNLSREKIFVITIFLIFLCQLLN